MKIIQYYNEEILKNAKNLKPEQILEFIENTKKLLNASRKVSTKLISMKVEEDLLQAFKTKCQLEGKRYQSEIKNLMRQALLQPTPK